MLSIDHLHPMLVHFPIALIMVGFLFDMASLLIRKEACLSFAGFWLLIIGTLATIATFFSGIFFTADMAGTAGIVRKTHATFAAVTMILLIINSLLRIYLKRSNRESSPLKWLSFAIYALAALMVGITGFYGGNLVYNHMMPL
jgi:uncharacterized membrane protein